MFLLIQNHPFRDGNKRIAAEAMLLFLARNGTQLQADESELDAFTTAIANAELRDGAITEWIEARTLPQQVKKYIQ